MSQKIVKTSCRNCHGGCGVLVTVENGVATKIRPNPESPLSMGHMCPKGLAGLELLYHPDRLKYPMKRAGKRGEGKWDRITWDEAYDIIAEKLLSIEKEYGMQSVAIAQGTGRHHLNYVVRFANSIGTPNWFEPGTAQCFFPRIAVGEMMHGYAPMIDYYSDTYPGCILVWGSNPAVSGADCESQFRYKDAVKHGSKIIVIDPKRTDEAKRADLFLQIRPGTDAALALGMINVIIKENLYDKDFVEKWCYGFEDLAKRAQEYPLERVSAITRIPPRLIVQAARMFATSGPGALEFGCAVEHTPNCLQTVRAIACIIPITGNLDKKGAEMEGMHILPDPDTRIDALGWEKRLLRLGEEKFKVLSGRQKDFASAHIPSVFDAMRTGKPYPIKALMLCGNNGLLGFADSKKTYETFMDLDFICSQELFMTPTTALADVVLPVASWLEVDAVFGGPTFADHVIMCQQKVVEWTNECKPDEVILLELCKRMGKDFGAESIEEIHNKQLEKIRREFPEYKDLDICKLRELGFAEVPIEYERYKRLNRGFLTNTGKVELYSTVMEGLGYDPLPYFEEPPESPVSRPDFAQRYPLILNTGERSPYFFISENRQMPSLRKLCPYPMCEMHPKTAVQYGIKAGDWVYIESLRGRITQKARLSEDMMEGVVNCQIGWWFPEKSAEDFGVFSANANVLTSMEPPYDKAMGTYQLRALLCRIYKNDSVTDADFDPGKSVEKFPLPTGKELPEEDESIKAITAVCPTKISAAKHRKKVAF